MNALERIENTVTDLAARVGPLIAPIPTAWAIGTSVVDSLGWPVPVGVIAGGAIELLGLATVNTALTLREYNASKRKSDPVAPFVLAAGLAGVYLVSAVSLAVVVDVVPSLVTWTPALFPFLSLAGVTVLALRQDHRRRLAGIAEAKAETSRKRAETRKRKSLPETQRQSLPAMRKRKSTSGNDTETRDRARAILAENPGISGSELGRLVGRSGRMGRLLKAELLPEVEIISVPGGNGNGRISGNAEMGA